jgi:F0F1-type ATP synthase membrane subunit b/b'
MSQEKNRQQQAKELEEKEQELEEARASAQKRVRNKQRTCLKYLFHHKKTKRNLIILNVLEKYVIVLKLFW